MTASTAVASSPTPSRALGAALERLADTQSAEGSWKGDYGGPLFLLPLYVATARIVGAPLDAPTRAGMTAYLRAHQNADGSFGLHVEGPGLVFTTVMNYVALRLLGEPADDPALARARTWSLAHGGPCASASWGKFMLALLGLYPWEGLDPTPPELWLLPRALPVHPGRLWCHCRMVYLPMAYLYGRRASPPRTAELEAIRRELYPTPFESIDWRAARDTVSPTDAYTPRSPLYRAVSRALDAFERRAPRALRRRALDFCLDQIRQEDENTDYLCIGPINKLLDTLVWHYERPGGEEVRRHLARLPDYLWQARDGLKMQGYNSSELWDTAFAVQAMCAAGPAARSHLGVLERAFGFIEQNQVLEDTPRHAHYFRHASRGGWPFSTRAHGWPISDCTAEGIKACLALEPFLDAPLPTWRLDAAVELVLSWQNPDGGWATYERTRGPRWLERLNPSDCFADIMIDYSYVECTSACVQALAAYVARFPESRSPRIDAAIARGRDFLREAQRADGSWVGSWGVCFTYGAWFAVSGLRAAGVPADDPAIERGLAFLGAHQRRDGGWGETVEACATHTWVDAEESQAVMTAWAVLAHLAAGRRGSPAVERGVRFLEARQRPDGSWPPERIAGVFNRTCAIHYDNYLKIFPAWALALAARG